MPDTFVTDMRHYLDESGEIPAGLPGPALNLALHQGAIVEWMTATLPEGNDWTNVYCRRSPGRQRCRGQIIARFDEEAGTIVWQCPICGDGGFIYGWAGTRWDRGEEWIEESG
jgi:hypothetical protein